VPNPKGINQYTKGRGRGGAPKLRRSSDQRASYAASLVGATKKSTRTKEAEQNAAASKKSADAMKRREENVKRRARGQRAKLR
jgi:hypothetical protein